MTPRRSCSIRRAPLPTSARSSSPRLQRSPRRRSSAGSVKACRVAIPTSRWRDPDLGKPDMRILITGGAGCLGSNLIEHWLPQGHEILVIDNFATGRREVVPALKGLALVEGSIADRNLVARSFDEFKPTHVVHSAASYKDPVDWPEDAATNVTGTI